MNLILKLTFIKYLSSSFKKNWKNKMKVLGIIYEIKLYKFYIF
jgi:hypothetical protein